MLLAGLIFAAAEHEEKARKSKRYRRNCAENLEEVSKPLHLCGSTGLPKEMENRASRLREVTSKPILPLSREMQRLRADEAASEC